MSRAVVTRVCKGANAVPLAALVPSRLSVRTRTQCCRVCVQACAGVGALQTCRVRNPGAAAVAESRVSFVRAVLRGFACCVRAACECVRVVLYCCRVRVACRVRAACVCWVFAYVWKLRSGRAHGGSSGPERFLWAISCKAIPVHGSACWVGSPSSRAVRLRPGLTGAFVDRHMHRAAAYSRAVLAVLASCPLAVWAAAIFLCWVRRMLVATMCARGESARRCARADVVVLGQRVASFFPDRVPTWFGAQRAPLCIARAWRALC